MTFYLIAIISGIIRIFDDKSIKQSTARKYQQLPEVQNKKLELKREENCRRNRIMAKIFTKVSKYLRF